MTDNLGLKLLALSLSVMLFSLVHSDVDAQRSMYLDVVTLLPPSSSGKMLVSELPTQVKVTLRGSRSKLSSLSRDQLLPVQLDLRSGNSGNYYLDRRAIDVGSNVQVLEISPAMVSLTWVVAAEKRVSVQVETEGDLGAARRLRADPEPEPSYVTLRGPAQRLQGLNTVSTQPVSLSGLGIGGHRRRVRLMPLPEHVSYVEDSAVEVRLVVVPVFSERTLSRLDVAVIGEEPLRLRPSHVAVTLRGSRELLDALAPDSIVPYVELAQASGITARPYDIRLRGVPEGIDVVRVLPPSVLVWPKGKR